MKRWAGFGLRIIGIVTGVLQEAGACCGAGISAPVAEAPAILVPNTLGGKSQLIAEVTMYFYHIKFTE